MTNTTAKTIRTNHNHDHPYFMLARETSQDNNLSYEALGMLTYLLSKPDTWETHMTDLTKRLRCGRDKAYRIVKELCDARYMKAPKKYQDKAGRWQ